MIQKRKQGEWCWQDGRLGGKGPSFLHRYTKLTIDGPEHLCENSADQLRSCGTPAIVKPRRDFSTGVGRFAAFAVPIHASPSVWHSAEQLRRNPQTGAPPLRWKQKSGLCVQHSGLSGGYWRNWFISCLTQSTDLTQSCSSTGRHQGAKEIQKGLRGSRTASRADGWSSPHGASKQRLGRGDCLFKRLNPRKKKKNYKAYREAGKQGPIKGTK